ncbi:putative O-glycosylation ligase, exosortase A system-associated [Neoroseomonas lacus]|uniref:O-antigen polymerase n=1 Tax=Neoroseomonas lacus TaxID=287609 RepID=A0A917L6G4_9PROT|nr:putative O-glycosylation ligase, exosortase A system-associated [Neoroseomonas lacus]GGJ45241.1 O-antigen polymerase [Neoroseomonas lacus]
MQALFILSVWTSLVALGCLAPFVLALAYVWVDLFRPHDVAPALGQLFPFSLTTAVLTLGAYVLVDRRDPPRLGLLTALLIIWAGWITLTTTWALYPTAAWAKWDWAFKTILFSTLLPFFFRSRIQIEAALLVILCCIASNVVCFAIKSVLASGGYGRPLGLIQINAGWGGEGSTLGTYAFACLPLVAFLQRHSIVAPSRGWLRWVYFAAPVIAVIGAFGTFARAALVACVVWAALLWWRSRHKFMVAIMLVAGAAAVVPLMGDAWKARISTSFAPRQDESANTRLLVWEWTIGLANQYPAGAGFNGYLGNRFVTQDEWGEDNVQEGRAFHSIYFEVLGEHGWVGLAIFLATFAVFFLNMRSVRRAARARPELEWIGDLARALSHGVLIFMAGAAFVGIAFYPLHYYLLALAVSTSAALHRATLSSADRAPQESLADLAVGHNAARLPAWRQRAGQTKASI